MVRASSLLQRVFITTATILGLCFVAFLAFNPASLVLAASDPLSGPITPTPTNPVSAPITPTATPTPKVSPTPTPTTVPSTTPTPSGTPTPTGNPTGTPTPTATPTPKVSPTPTPTTVPSTTPTPTSSPTPTPTIMPTQYIVDNSDSRFSTQGAWKVSTTGSGYFGANYVYTKNQEKRASAEWRPNIPAGTYDVYVRYVSSKTSSKKVVYTTASGNGIKTYSVDQRRNGGQWVKLGTFVVSIPVGNYVRVMSATGGETTADAVLFQKLY